jgi:hypothetical protein
MIIKDQTQDLNHLTMLQVLLIYRMISLDRVMLHSGCRGEEVPETMMLVFVNGPSLCEEVREGTESYVVAGLTLCGVNRQ